MSGPTSLARTTLRSRWLPWGIVAGGVLLRLNRYADQRSLWGDEGALALNIVDRSWSELLQKLDFLQGAPTGFLLAEKASVLALGETELALRLVPLLSGVIALVLFAVAANRLLQPAAALIAILLAATSEPLVYYSSEVKQYSTDVAVGLILLVAALLADRAALTIARASVLAAIGAAAAWFSHAALLVLPGLAAALLLAAWMRRDRRSVRTLVVVTGAWGVAAITAYAVNSSNARRVASAALGANGSESGPSLGKPLKGVWNSFADPIGVANTATALAAVAALVGLVSLARRRPESALLTSAPIATTVLAAMAGRYPFSDRFVLFLAPFFILLIAEGVHAIAAISWKSVPAVGVASVALLLVYPLGIAARNLVSPPGHEEVRSTTRYVADRWRSGDALFVWYQTQYPFRFYAECRDCGVVPTSSGLRRIVWPPSPSGLPGDAALTTRPPQLYVGRKLHDLAAYAEEFAPLRGRPRVWLLFSSTWEDDFVRYTLDCLGVRLEEFRNTRAVAYLYDLSSEAAPKRDSCSVARRP